MKMKQICALLLSAGLALSMAACGDGGDDAGASAGGTTLQPTFTEIAENSVFDVNYYAGDDSFMAGTASCVNVDFWDEPVMITAFHIFDLEKGSELEDYLDGGDVFDTFSDPDADPLAYILYNATPDDAEPVPKVNKDVAAFLLNDTSSVHAFDLAKADAKKGDTVYLLANLTNSETVNPDGIYPAVVTSVDEGSFQYKLDAKYGTGGASGAPIVNGNGEVVGIHIGSNGSTRTAHSANSIRAALKFTFDEYREAFLS